jgi:hypothetical protein
MKPIRILESDVVKKYASDNKIEGEIIKAENLLKDVSSNLGALIYIDQAYLESNLSACLEHSDLIQFHIVKEDGRRFFVLGNSDYQSEDRFIRSAYAEQAAITYVHELNNHLAIICGRLYEFKKIRKSIEGELGEKFETKLESMNEKLNQITDISRLFTRKSFKAIIPGTGENIPMQTIVNNIARDYRKILEKSSNVIRNDIAETIEIPLEKAVEVENILIAIMLKFARCTIKEGDGTQTTVDCSVSGDQYDFTFVLEGNVIDEIQDNFYHRSWLNFLSKTHEKNCRVEVFQGKNKIQLELSLTKSWD